MKKMLFPIFVLTVFIATAQTATVTLSKEFVLKNSGLNNNAGVTFKLGDYCYSIAFDYKNIQLLYTAKLDKVKYDINISKYDADMKEIGKIKLNNGEREYGPFPPQALIQNNKLLLFFYQAQKDHSITLRVTTFDPETFTETATNDIYTIPEKNVGLFKVEGAIRRNSLKLVRSASQKELLVAQSGNTNEIFTCILNSNNEITNTTVSPINDSLNDFKLQNLFLDGSGNKYFSYTYVANNLNKRGILVQNNKGKEEYLDFNTGQAEWDSNTLNFCAANHDSTMYLYANYYGNYMDEGILLSLVNAESLTLGSVQLFPYTDDIKVKMNKLGFGSKNKGNLTVDRVDYVSTVLADGTVALSGFPAYSVTVSNTVFSAAGPVINAFIKEGHCNFAILYRKERWTDAAALIATAYKNSLVCIYCDSRKNLALGNAWDIKNIDEPSDLVLVQAVISSDGTILSKKEIAGDPVGSNYYYTNNAQRLLPGSYLIPVGSERASMMSNYTEIVQWAKLDIE